MYETSSITSEINFAPANLFEEVQQNIITLLKTVAGSVPLERGLGIDVSALDQPVDIASAMIAASALEAIDTFEPRCLVRSITTTYDTDGRIVPVVRWQLREEE